MQGSRRPLLLPIYTIREASDILGIPRGTVRNWVVGGYSGALIRPASPDDRLLSFVNLVEAHVLRALRKVHEVSMQAVRQALQELPRHSDAEHPLAFEDLLTGENQVFLEKYGQLINLNRSGQLRAREWLAGHLARVKRDAFGPVALFPMFPQRELASPETVECDPEVMLGQPVIAGTRILTSVVASRYNSGESPRRIAEDLHQSEEKILDAIRFEAA